MSGCKAIEMTGMTFGALKVTGRATENSGASHSYRRSALWCCECTACGKNVVMSRQRLMGGASHCGCRGRQRRRPDYRIPRKPRQKESQTLPSNLFQGLGMEYACPECKRVFLCPTTDWGYMIGEKRYCSWTCLRKVEKRSKKRRYTNI